MVHIRQINQLNVLTKNVQTITLKKGSKFHELKPNVTNDLWVDIYHAGESQAEDEPRNFVVVDRYDTVPKDYRSLGQAHLSDNRVFEVFVEPVDGRVDPYPYTSPNGDYEFPECTFEIQHRRLNEVLFTGVVKSAAGVLSLLENYSDLDEVAKGGFLTALQKYGTVSTNERLDDRHETSVKVRTVL